MNAAITIQTASLLRTVAVETALLRETIVNPLFFFTNSTVAAELSNICEIQPDRMFTTKDPTSPAQIARRAKK